MCVGDGDGTSHHPKSRTGNGEVFHCALPHQERGGGGGGIPADLGSA